MESDCHHDKEEMQFKAPRISHSITVMVFEPNFHTKDTDGVRDGMGILILPERSLAAGLEALLLN